MLPATRGTVGAVPFVGGLLGEVMGFVWIPALERRQAEWFKKLGEVGSNSFGHVLRKELRELKNEANTLFPVLGNSMPNVEALMVQAS